MKKTAKKSKQKKGPRLIKGLMTSIDGDHANDSPVNAPTGIVGLTSSPVSACYHYGKQIVLNVRGLNISACTDKDKINGRGIQKLFLNCTGFEEKPILRGLPEQFSDLYAHTMDDEYITVCWPDGGAPDLLPSFWYVLPDVCLREGYELLTVYCMGSHGRTGTALAALAIVNFGMTAVEAVQYVRKTHCMKAVETYRQFDYLDSVEVWAYEQGHCMRIDPLKHSQLKPSYCIGQAVKVTESNSVLKSAMDIWKTTDPGKEFAAWDSKLSQEGKLLGNQ